MTRNQPTTRFEISVGGDASNSFALDHIALTVLVRNQGRRQAFAK